MDDMLIVTTNEVAGYRIVEVYGCLLYTSERLKDFNQKFNLWNDGKACSKVVKRIFNEN